jgi:hypothetical protein
MMLPTHILAGMLLGAAVASFAPGESSVLLLAGAIGGMLPDIDMVVGEHRQTLHFPVYYMAAAAVSGIAALTVHPLFTAITVFFLGAGVHCLMDVLGGGKELRPWEGTDDRAVYNHATGSWVMARRYFYAGSVTDLAISIIAAILLFPVTTRYQRLAVVFLTGTALSFTLLLPSIARWVPQKYDTFSAFLRSQLSRGRRLFFPSR